MRIARVIRTIIYIVISVLTLTVPIVATFGGLSIVQIISNPGNIAIPDGEIDANFDLFDPSLTYVIIPFNITNAGYYPLSNLYIRLEIAMLFNNPIESRTIINKRVDYPSILQGESYKGNFTMNSNDLQNVPSLSEINITAPISMLANITFHGGYAYGLFSFTVKTYNLNMFSFP